MPGSDRYSIMPSFERCGTGHTAALCPVSVSLLVSVLSVSGLLAVAALGSGRARHVATNQAYSRGFGARWMEALPRVVRVWHVTGSWRS